MGERHLMREAIAAGNVEWRKHVLERMVERGIRQADVLQTVREGENIEDYPGETPFPSALYLGFPEGDPLHVVAAFDRANLRVYIITAYEPDDSHFLRDFKTRR